MHSARQTAKKMNSADPAAVGDDAFLDELEAFLALPLDRVTETTTAISAPFIHRPVTDTNAANTDKTHPKTHHGNRLTVATTASKGGSNRKRTLDCLRAEADQLTSQLRRLCHSESIAAMETAVVERWRRRKAEAECQALREAVYTQTQFVCGLRAMFGPWQAPGTSVMDIAQYLHKFTRLPRALSTRSSECVGMVEEARLAMAARILERESQLLTESDGCLPSTTSPFIESKSNTLMDGLSVATSSVYALETSEIDVALRSVFVAVSEIVSTCNHCHYIKVRKQIVDPGVAQTTTNLLYRIMGVDHTSVEDQDKVTVESRNVMLYKRERDHAVVLWDFVDDDELHPIGASTDVTRQATGAGLLRRERCDDGHERVVFRSLNTRRYRFHQHARRRETLDRYTRALGTTRRDHELMFRALVIDAVVKEEATTLATLVADT